MGSEIPGPVDGVDDADLSAVVSTLISIPNSQADDPDRFAAEVRHIAEKRAQAMWSVEGNDDIGVFVLARYPREVGMRLGGTPVVDILATATPILGKLFLLNRDASNGFSVSLPIKDPAQLLLWLTDQGLGGSAIVIIYRATKYIVVRPNGTAGDAQEEILRDKPPVATISELLDALKHFHRTKLLIPSVCPKGVWQNGRAYQYVPGPAPERSIQRELATALNFWFRGVIKAELEDTTDIGRIDVRLLQTRAGHLSYWAIIELKVVKSFHNAPKGKSASAVSHAENVGAISKGIRQAHAYWKNRQAEAGLLEVFDLRKDKSGDILGEEEIKETISLCEQSPTTNLRHVFGSAEHARAAGWT